MDGSTITEIPTMIKKFTLPGDFLVDIACGPGHTLVKSQKGILYSWGEAYRGKLGLGYSENQRDHQHQHFPKQLAQQKNSNDIKTLKCGLSVSVALKQDGDLFMTGKPEY